MAEHLKLNGYTPKEAQAILAFVEVKIPGILRVAEKTLRDHGVWPEDDMVAAPTRGGEGGDGNEG